MKTSEQTGEISAALAKAQSKMQNASLNKDNPFFKSKYADLAGIRDTVTPALSENQIAVSQTTEIDNGSLFVCTRLMHSSSQWIESRYPIMADTNKPQAMGSAMTYARRYSLSAICGISSEQDDDGNEAAEHGRKAPETRNVAGTPKASKAVNREPFTKLISEARLSTSVDMLRAWVKTKRAEIDALPPDWVDEFSEEYETIRESLSVTAA